MPTNFPMPLNDPLVNPRRRGLKPDQRDENEGKVTETWIPYLQSQNTITATAIRNITTVPLSAQSASIGVTAIPTSSLASGLYRVGFFYRITTAASVSSSLLVTFHFTDGGVSCTFPSVANTGNTTSTVDSDFRLINVDAATPISYSTTYASVGAPAMSYELFITLEDMNA